jgi:hypothetical protein
MRIVPLTLVRRHARLLFATLAATAIAASTMLARFGTFDPAYDGELWGVRNELTPGNGATPSGVAFVNGTLFVGDSTNNTVIAYDSTGQIVPKPGAQWDTSIPTSPISGMTVNQLAAIVVTVDGTDRDALLISDGSSNRAAAFDTTGAYLFTLRLTRPSNTPLYALSIGEIATTGGAKFTFNTISQALSFSGSMAAAWSEQAASGGVDSGALVFQGPTTFPLVGGEHQATATQIVNGTENDPEAPSPLGFASVAYDKTGNLYALDAYTERLSVYDPSLQRLFTFGTPVADGTTAEFREPWGMAFWPDATGNSGRLLVNDTYTSRILVYRPVDGPDADSVIDGLQLETTIKGFAPADPALELFSLAIDPLTATIAVTDFAQPRALVLQKPALAAFDLQVLDASDAVLESVCTGAAYKVRFSLTVPAGSPAVIGVTPRLRIDGVPVVDAPVPGGAYPSTTLAAGDVVTFTYSLTAPLLANADVAVIADATATNTTDVMGRAQTIPVANCAGETDPSTITATPSRAPQVSGWTPVFVGENFHVTLDAQDDDGIDGIEYQLDGANNTGDDPIETHFDGLQTAAQLAVSLPDFGRTTMRFRVRDGNMIWSGWHSLAVRPKLVVDRSTNENVDVEFRVGDPEGVGFTYSVTGLPAGVTFFAGTGQFGGVVSFDAVKPYVADPIMSSGVYPVVITETAPSGQTSSVGFTWTINNINREPIITNQIVPGLSINKGELFQMQIVGFDPDDDPSIFTVNGRGLNNGQDLPQSVTIDPVTGLLSGTFPQEADNAYRITVGLAECAEQTPTPPCNRPLQGGTRLATLLGFELAVLDVNQPADIVNPGPQTSAEGDTVALHIQASDPDGDLLTFEAGGLPAGLSITRLDGETALISGTLAWGSAGSYAVTVKADDHVNAVKRSVTFAWVVTHTNRPPVVTVIDKTSVEGSPAVGFVFGTDPDNDPLTYSAVGLPPGASMDSHGVFTGAFDYDAAGVYHVTLTISDGTAQITVTFTWTVLNVNRPPTLVTPPRFSAEGDVVLVTINASDPDGDELTFSYNGLPVDLSLDANTGVITGTFSYTSAGTYNVNIGVSDGKLAVLSPFVWTVTETNRPPTVTAIPDRLNAEADTVLLQVVASDPDGDLGLTYSATNLPPGLSINPLTGQITGTLTYVSAGIYGVTVTVSDGKLANHATTVSFTWTVTNVNRPPTASALPRTNLENDVVSFSITSNDPDSDSLTFTATGLPPGISINPATGVISGHLPYNSAGLYPVVVTVSDGSLSAAAPFLWTVTDVNTVPVITQPADKLNAEGNVVSVPVVATDADGDTLTFSAVGLPPGLSIDPATGVVSGTLPYTSAGVYTVTVTVSDGVNVRSVTFKWTVTNVNRPPVVTQPANQNSAQGAVIVLPVLATDPDNDPLTYSATGLPPGLTINPTTGVISGTISFTATGIYTVTVTASDGSLSDSKTFTWKVSNTNRQPTVSAPDRLNAENDTVSYPTTASDPDGDALTYSATGLPAGITIDPTTGLISGTLGYTTAGIYHPTITVSDGSLSASATFTWTVTETNAPPVVTNPGNLVNNEGETISRQIVATDADGNNTLTFSAVGLPPGLSISASGLVTGTLSYTSAGVYTVTVTVSDGVTSRAVTFTWTVINVNRPPVVINPGAQTTPEGATVLLPISASDPDLQTLTYSATGLPPGLSINATTGVISGTVPYTASGTYTVTVSASDGSLSDSKTFTWVITNVNRAPKAVDDTSSVTQGQSVVINVRANDSDEDGQTLTVTNVTTPSSGSVVISGGGTTVTYAAAPTFVGTATFYYTVSDGTATATAKVTVTVLTSNQPPVCSAAYGGEIWPPNHKRFYIASINGVTDPEKNPITIKVTGIWQDELLDSTGDGQFSPDGRIVNGLAWVRAERNGHQNKAVGDGRVYEILFTATDSKGASCDGSVFWTVPHDQGQRAIAIDSGVRYDSTGVIPGTRDKTQIHQLSQQ